MVSDRCFVARLSGRISILLAAITFFSLAGCVVEVGPRPRGYYRERVVYYPPPAEVYYYPPPQTPAPPPPVEESSAAQLQQLVAPVALYPDPLLADVLAAATFPDQIQAANEWTQANPGAPQDVIDLQPWDISVKALVHYPSVLAYMNGDIEWTASLGSAFTCEQPDVMASIQDLRQQAIAAGSLVTTPQQVVVQDGNAIYIQPADPSAIYVPAYDPVIVYSQPVVIVYGPPCVCGVWFVHAFDWDHHGFYVVDDWRAGWVFGYGGWHRDPGFGWYRYHAWARDDRWGPPPHRDFNHYAVRREMQGRQFAAVHADHMEAARREPARAQTRQQQPQRSAAGAKPAGQKPGSAQQPGAEPNGKPSEANAK